MSIDLALAYPHSEHSPFSYSLTHGVLLGLDLLHFLHTSTANPTATTKKNTTFSHTGTSTKHDWKAGKIFPQAIELK